MTAADILIRAAKETAERKASQNGHRLGPWVRNRSWRRATCYVCAARVVIDSRGSISGPALTARCKAPVPASGRAA